MGIINVEKGKSGLQITTPKECLLLNVNTSVEIPIARSKKLILE